MEPSLTLAVAPARYARHQPETTLLCQLVERHYRISWRRSVSTLAG
jgi:hypothetical protein